MYKDTVKAPGNITIATNGSSASWASAGDADQVGVIELDVNGYPTANVTMIAPASYGGANAVSPTSIPAATYVAGKSYAVNVIIRRSHLWIDALKGADGLFRIQDTKSQVLVR